MEAAPLQRILPSPTAEVDLRGLYLSMPLGDAAPSHRVATFSNFVVSLDGRISLPPGPDEPPRGVPEALAGDRDWRLYQELAAQADVVLTTGRYVRELGEGSAGPVLTFPSDPKQRDILEWRMERGLGETPAFAVVSSRVDFDPEVVGRLGTRVLVVTGAAASADGMRQLRDGGIEVMTAGDGDRVDGRALTEGLFARGFRLAFAAAGGALLRVLLDAGVLDWLFLTRVHAFLGGTRFSTLVQGDLLLPPATFALDGLYLDPHGPGGASQAFEVYRPATGS
jgi:riboflavin biosynthesis pyrimidine reductase